MKKVNTEAFLQGSPLYLKQLPAKWEVKRLVIKELVAHISNQSTYTERTITTYLARFCDDPVELRRYLVDFNFMTRSKDGSCYQFLGSQD